MPREIGDEKRGVENISNDVLDTDRWGKGSMPTFVGDHPNTDRYSAVDPGVEHPYRSPRQREWDEQ